MNEFKKPDAYKSINASSVSNFENEDDEFRKTFENLTIRCPFCHSCEKRNKRNKDKYGNNICNFCHR
jgi:hypothetical protein